ncbi:MAG TPA: hypothetical protein PKL48_08785, partial [Thermodesulfobacteriota bacterium]|nr:hypothetical protein [Thermodesulfobacteriota bacterium]
MNIIQCLEDPKLLGQFIKTPETFTAWRTFHKASAGIPGPTREELKIYRECTGRSKWPKQAADESWMIIGTRGGKSFNTALKAAHLAVFVDYPMLSPGEVGTVIVVAPVRRQARVIKRYLSGFFKQNPLLAPMVVSDSNEELVLNNGIEVAILSDDFRGLRNYTAVAVVIDEAAYLGGAESASPDVEILRSLRTRLLNTEGPLLAISSPYARKGIVFDTHRRHFGKDGDPILVWKAGSGVMNPTLSRKKMDRMREEDPEGAAADLDAEFRSDLEDYVRREVVEACVIPGRYELPFIQKGVTYRAFA